MQKQLFLVSGFISDNFVELSSFFKTIDVEESKIAKQISHKLKDILTSNNSMGVTNNHKIQDLCNALFQKINTKYIQKNCYIADQRIIYICDQMLQSDQNICYILCYENPIEILKQNLCLSENFSFECLLKEWYLYNNFMLEFYKKNKEKSVLINYQHIEEIVHKIQINNTINKVIKYKNTSNKRRKEENCDFLLEYVLNTNYQVINDCYKELEKNSSNGLYRFEAGISDLEKQVIAICCKLKSYSLLKQKNEKILEHLFLLGVDIENKYNNDFLCNQNNEKNKIIEFYFRYGTAKQRIQDQLSYKLGQILIENSKNIFGICSIPFIMLAHIIVFRQKRKSYLKRIKKTPSLKLPPLEQYPDYSEALKLKNHLSYRLGNFIITNPLKSCFCPYFILKIIYQFKKEKHVKQ
ncbi:hypothetical protein CK573_07340 [Campylobacter lari]|uniref:hypothetical protein n=1 Tax=Campylobacter lari TaxID=201 RepID=UPI001276CAA8|nr:hypothetical protein [Campylobacter lari]EAJ8706381.1 hypothetical protein [Campylobacter jejuni]EAI7253433.1 hypothetical protein [Campylobacter lari]EAL0060403.1 hypothetical protein [Campylobacter lari]ECL4969357.1 hypothetical protein [Campylobacter lari]EHL5011882.1 hypothetical protein [Campylobacter lari]